MTTTTRARARKDDPETSHAAAATVHVGTTRERVLALLVEAGPAGLTHDELIARHRSREWRAGWPEASVSSLRSRCSELFRDGLVGYADGEDGHGTGKSSGGRRAVRWRALDVHNGETTGQEV